MQATKKVHTKVDRDTCIGCGTCASICPKYYVINDEDMKAYVQENEIETVDNLDMTIDMCPVGAISWHVQNNQQ